MDATTGAAPGGFLYRPTGHFTRRLEQIRRSDPEGWKHITAVVARLLEHPEDHDGMLRGHHRGKLKKYVGRSDYRLVFNWCRECRKANTHLHDACPLCPELPDNSVVFLDVFHKSEHRKLGY